MRIPARNLRIGGASLIAVILVAGGYLLPGAQFPETKAVNAELTDELLASYVSKDTDGDGLPDWQETLYGTNLNVADTDGDGISDGEAVRQGLLTPTALASQLPNDPVGEEDIPGEPPAPGSLTEQFSRAFLETYIQAGGGQQMTVEQQETTVQNLLLMYRDEAVGTLGSSYTKLSVRTNPTISATSYAGTIEQVLETAIPDAPDSDGILLAERLIKNDDETARGRLLELAVQYERGATNLLTVTAPPPLADNHLKLMQAVDQYGNAVAAIGAYEKDPVLAMGALSVLLPAQNQIIEAFSVIAEAVVIEGEPGLGMPGRLMVDTVRLIQAQ